MELKELTIEEREDLLSMLESRVYRELFVPYMIQSRISVIVRDLCETDCDDERNRGGYKELKRLLGAEQRIRKELKEARKRLNDSNNVDNR